MSPEEHFTQVLREWSQLFMHRSVSEFKHFMDDSGLSATQFHAMMRLYYSPGEDGSHSQGGCNVSGLGSHLGISNAASSQMIDRLVQFGFILRSENPSDRREKHVALSAKGRALIEEGIEARRSWMETLTFALTPEEQQAIIHALTLLIQAARELEPSAQVEA